ncbi:MAG: hypothetical protein J6T06_00710 [Victivallales bacterium]|nr:hypothetical protein [Victivallales bacterium]
MSKKKHQPQAKPEEPLGDNWTNPFKDLNIKFEEPDPPPPPPPKPTFEEQHPTLTKEDRALIAAFGAEDDDAPSLSRADMTKKWPLLTITHERKGRGGKTVTLVKGLERLTTLEQMELCDGIKPPLASAGVSWTEHSNCKATNENAPPSGWRGTNSERKSADSIL